MNSWTVTQWHDALSIAETLTLAIVVVLGLYLRTTFASRKDLTRANDLMDDGFRLLEARVAACEQRHATAPDPGRVLDMGTSIAGLAASVEAVRRELGGLDNRLDRIETHLLKQASR